ncbi:MAG: sulfatase-like hydrolase/transferase [Chloroflexi bacterium]|nr:sulfatase-like hydrolase/transferase [Chloroflexota bacterium]
MEHYPKGPPHIAQDNVFLLQDAINWIQTQTIDLPQQYLAYFHLLPPHDPYASHREFIGAFDQGGYKPVDKPLHFLRNKDPRSKSKVAEFRKAYDEFILNLDSEFGRLYDFMEENGILENTWVIFTSDHGEIFERGIRGHRQPTFHQPVIHVPLMILEPGNTTRRDIFSPTTAVDLLPTLLHLTDQKPPDFLKGGILPPFRSDNLQSDEVIYAVDAQQRDRTVKRPLTLSPQCY